MQDKIMEWLRTHSQTCGSSKVLARHLCGLECDGTYPQDQADFNRCLLFFEEIPEAREALPRMSTLNNTWARLVAQWQQLEDTFLAEMDHEWSNVRFAPKTYWLLHEIIDTARWETKLQEAANHGRKDS